MRQASEVLVEDERIRLRADVLRRAGYGRVDALHLSFSETAAVDALLTTDDRFLRRAANRIGSPRVRVLNPVQWVQEQSR